MLSDEEAKRALAHHLDDAVKLRLVSDVPIGAFLSGGIDNSAMVAFMQKASARPVKTFSIGFEESDYDESAHAARVGRHLGTEHHELRVKPADALALIPKLPEFYDEPFADSSQIPTLLLSQLTRHHVTVALSGDGGDELFAGYPRYELAAEIIRKIERLPKAMRSTVAHALRHTPELLWRALEPLVPKRFGRSPLSQRVRKLADLMGHDAIKRLYQSLIAQWPEPEHIVLGASRADEPIWRGALAGDVKEPIRRFQLIDTMTYLPDDILVKVDRASMAVSLEARTPLLDHRLVEFVWRLPNHVLTRDSTQKWLLRQVLYDHVPRDLIDRPKMGFGVPIAEWLRGPLRDWAEDLLDERKLREAGYLDPTPIRSAWAEHLAGRAAWHYRLWCVLMFEAWRRRWHV